jgi:transcriptional regulator with XRE-family HTH domain
VAARRALFGSLIRTLREKAGHSLSKVAAKIGASTANTARSYESGCYPAGSTIRRYGPVLGVKSRDLALARLYCQDVELYHLLYGTAPPVALRRHLQALPSERLTALLTPLPAPEAALLRAAIRPKEGPLL